MFRLRDARESLCLELHAALSYKKQLVKKISSRRNYVTVYVGLIPKLAKKLENLAKKQGKTKSKVLRPTIEAYLQYIEKRGL